ncbi:MAG: MBL fold metallo-hydrolase [Candidatus Azambacteria bacterium]|nr:MBL fold metallo-hydrolase [Candidatus Azambacteria bacterium]
MRIATAEDFKLKNGGELEIFFIGTGSAFAATMNQTNFLIVKGDTHIMVDFGMTAPRALLETARLKPTDIEVFLPTHSHADHVGGLECLALMNRYVGMPFLKKPKLKVIITDEYQRILWDYTLRGGLEWNEETPKTGTKLSFGDFFEVIKPQWLTFQPREVFRVQIGDIDLEIFRTKHIPEQAKNWEASFVSYGLLVDDRVFLSGDTRFDLELIEMFQDRAEIMFHDVQFFPGAVHAFLRDLKGLPQDAKKKMYLMHYADNRAEQDISDFAGWAQQGIRYIFD